MEQFPYLNKAQNTENLRDLSQSELQVLCEQARQFLIESISKTGGHLASNLGIVEISVATMLVFDSPKDSLMYDVGHQCYVHKMLSGRASNFPGIRSFGGISGFLRPSESEHDCFVSGHASNSISAVLGMARANALMGKQGHCVAVIGDGALTGGMAYEALNDAGSSGLPIIVVLNDNDMSISRNIGALAKRLSEIRVKPRYLRLKGSVKSALSKVPGGKKLISLISALKARLRTTLLKETIFELFGFKYLGPADGNDLPMVTQLFKEAKKMACPVVVHLKTVKGKGYSFSEENPDLYHGVPPFDTTKRYEKPINDSFSAVFGRQMCALAQQDKRVCAVTAAMTDGTGLEHFATQFADRFFDIGIAEAHGVTMAAAMASKGLVPVYAIYSTFLQRGFDQLIHDVAIERYHVVFAVDRAGIVGADGETHQGQFDVPYLLSIPNFTLLSPSSFSELEAAMNRAVHSTNGPVAVRYPRGGQLAYTQNNFNEDIYTVSSGDNVTIVTYGIMLNNALEAAQLLQKSGISCEIIKFNNLSTADLQTFFNSVCKTKKVAFVEDCGHVGSLGAKLSAELMAASISAQAVFCNLGTGFVPAGDVATLESELGLSAKGIAKKIAESFYGRSATTN